jgi:hypothetical protein
MEPELSLPHSQVPGTYIDREPAKSNPSNFMSFFRSLDRNKVSNPV